MLGEHASDYCFTQRARKSKFRARSYANNWETITVDSPKGEERGEERFPSIIVAQVGIPLT